MYSPDSEVFTSIISSIVVLVIFIVLIIKFFKLSKDVRLIKEKLYGKSKLSEAMIFIADGKKDEALELIRLSFLEDCIKILEEQWYDSYKCDEIIKDLINHYFGQFKFALLDFSKDFLLFEYNKVRKFYIPEENN
jgi:hypothetical protein